MKDDEDEGTADSATAEQQEQQEQPSEAPPAAAPTEAAAAAGAQSQPPTAPPTAPAPASYPDPPPAPPQAPPAPPPALANHPAVASPRDAGMYNAGPQGPDYAGYTGFQQMPPPPAPIVVDAPQKTEPKSTAITVRCTPSVRDEFRTRTMGLAVLHRVPVEVVNTFILQELIHGAFFNNVQERLLAWQHANQQGHGGNGQV